MTDESAPRPRRRPRYRGAHPRRFEERYKELRPEQYPDVQEHVRAQGRTPAGTHVPVLLAETLAALDPQPGEIAADCTLGYGGHAVEVLRRIGPRGMLIGFDVDGAELERTRRRLESLGGRLHLCRSNFAGLDRPLRELRIEGYDAVLADLGVSSMQIDDPARGFSYKHDGPLDMRMDDRIAHTAADLLRTLPEGELSDALRTLADEPDHAAIARRIIERRASRPLVRTRELAALVLEAKGITPQARREAARRGEAHPAAPVFQALRMLVNDEPGALKQFLRLLPWCLRPGGRAVVISFHSGEDRWVESSFAAGLRDGTYAAVSPAPTRPTPQEIRANPRAASARLRWARKA